MVESFFIIDRIVGSIAVCESVSSGEYVDIEVKLLPDSAGEGDVICQADGRYEINHELTAHHKREAEERLRRIFGD